MRWAINLGRWFGIKVLVHWTFFLILIWIAWITTREGTGIVGFLFTTALIFTVFFCVVLHEFGHALSARRYGIGTRWIVLLPIGGVAQLEKMPEEPREELVVAIMGPVVNLVIFVFLAIILILFPPAGLTPLTVFGNMDVYYNYLSANPISVHSFIFMLALINVVLIIFNLIPAFPMDGGRVLRALLAIRMDYVKATVVAARIGQGFAIVFALVGIFNQSLLLLIAIFVYLGAQGEATMVKNKFAFRGFKVMHGMLTRFKTMKPDQTLKDAVDELLAGSDKDFIIASEGRVLGILTRDKLVEALSSHGNAHPIEQVMERNFPVIAPHENLEFAVAKMKELNLPILPVMQGDEMVGAISMENVSEFFLVNKSVDVQDRYMLDAG